MTDLVLVLRGQFGAGAVTLGHPEQRIIAEAVLALRGMQDAAMPEPLAEYRQRILGMADQCQGADELRATLGIRHLAERIEQLGIVRRIALAVRITSRVDPRRAAEMIHGQPRVVGQRRQAGNPGGIARLEDGVLDERQPGLLGFHVAELAHRAHAYRVAEHGLQFLELAGVVAGQHQFVEGHHSSGKNS